ncbi:hypothetical protein D3C86_1619820 [compost metagenome]
MTKFLVASLMVIISLSEAAQAHNSMNHNDAAVAGISASTLAFYSSLGSSATTEDNKRRQQEDDDYYKLIQAQEDLALFVASDGTDGRTAKVQAAFEVIRKKAPTLQMSDTQIAKQILGME